MVMKQKLKKRVFERSNRLRFPFFKPQNSPNDTLQLKRAFKAQPTPFAIVNTKEIADLYH